jgi:Glycosyltransferase family 87
MSETAQGRTLALPHRVLTSPRWGYTLLAVACISLVAFGIAGVGREAGFSGNNGDMQFLYVAGRCWMLRANPYDIQTLHRIERTIPQIDLGRVDVGFAYPPQTAPLCLLLSMLPFEGARVLMTLLNLVCMVAIAWLCIALIEMDARGPMDPSLRLFVPTLVVGNPFTQHVLYMGQTSLLATACLLGGFYVAQRTRGVMLAGLLLGLSTIKPQIVILPITWFLLTRYGRGIPAFVAAVLVLSAWPLAVSGPIGTGLDWLQSVRHYEQGAVQVAGFRHVFSLPSLIASAGFAPPTLWPLAVAVLLGLLWRRARYSVVEATGILVGVSFLFIYAHDYDLVALVPLLIAAWTRAREDDRRALLVSAALIALCVPQRLLRFLEVGPLLHWRELVVLSLVGWVALVASRSLATPSPALPAGASG